MKIGKYYIQICSGYENFYSSGIRLNTGGYMYGASPYKYWRIWKIMIRRYL